MKNSECSVIRNEKVAAETYLLDLKMDKPLDEWMPGQFVMIKVDAGIQPFLRRPFAILGYDEDVLSVLYKVKGQGTEILSKKTISEKLWVLGPLGNGFAHPDKDAEVFYVAGGTGLPPILCLAEHLKKGHFILGAKTSQDLSLVKRIMHIPNVKTTFTTEDGSYGIKGMVTDVLKEHVYARNFIYACGPHAMLNAVYAIAAAKKAKYQVSLEEHMACGFGVCRGCAVHTKSGYVRVCKEGPVFDAADLTWE